MYTTGDAENYMLSMFMSIDKNYSGVIDLRELLAVMVRGEHTVHSTHSTRSTRPHVELEAHSTHTSHTHHTQRSAH
jgi:hypothetical protein